MHHSLDRRKSIIEQKESGKTLRQISQDLIIPYSTVKRIWQGYKKSGHNSLELNYKNCGSKRPKFYKMYRRSVWLKRKHPNWGAPFILTLFKERYPLEKLPSTRTVQKWFRYKKLNKTYIIREQPKIAGVKQVHDCWQIDAKERIELLDKSKACYLTTVDVKSGALLAAPVFSLWLYQSSASDTNKTVSDKSLSAMGNA